MRSLRELLETTDIAKISATLAMDAERTQSDLAEIVSTNPGDRDKAWITGMLTPQAKRQVQAVCRAWNVSESQMIRLVLARVFGEYGFPSSHLLLQMDHRALNRFEKSRRPFTTREEASQKRTKNLVRALDSGSDDAPQPLRVHEARAQQPAEDL